MKSIVSVAFLSIDGIWEIRTYNKTPDNVDLRLQWPDGRCGIFIGYTLNGFLKYKEVR